MTITRLSAASSKILVNWRLKARAKHTFASSMSVEQIKSLRKYAACDISDALLKLQSPKPGQRATAGFLDGIVPQWTEPRSNERIPALIAPASTVQFQPKAAVNGSPSLPKISASNIEQGTHWVDHTTPGTIVVIQQPEGQKCAVVGGIIASRMSQLGAKGLIVSGRVRDIEELRSLNLPILAKSTSTVGTSAEGVAYAIQVPVRVGEVEIKPGDIIFCDIDGVVAIPAELLEEVLQILPSLVKSDEMVKSAVNAGMSIQKAFTAYRK